VHQSRPWVWRPRSRQKPLAVKSNCALQHNCLAAVDMRSAPSRHDP
jgi:hypothetical protein